MSKKSTVSTMPGQGHAPPPEGYLTIHEAGEIIRAGGQRVTDQRLYDLAADGRMPSERFGRNGYRTFVPQAPFDEWRTEHPEAITQRRVRSKSTLAPTPDPDAATIEHNRRVQLGKLGAYTMHARHDSRATTRAGHLAFMSRFEREVDPQGILPPAERARRASAARKAYFTQMAYKRNYTKPEKLKTAS